MAAAERHGLGLVVDIVPNHLGISAPAENPYWWDVLAFGPGSRYAHWFDIDWGRGRLTVPVLGDDPVLSIENGELRYYEHRFPLAPGTWQPGDDPDDVHARQHYELIHHSRGNAELTYRRFFAVTTLAGIRVEDEDVFEGTHRRVRRWADAGLTGLRIDHPDGLLDPAQYLERLRALAPEAWITVEKILEPGEQLPDWPVAGTTGYDAMREVNGVFIDADAGPALTELYQRLTGDQLTIAAHIEQGKEMVVADLLPAEVRRIAALAPEVPDAGPAVAALAVAFAVYRSYLPAGAADLDRALTVAEQRHPELVSAFAALRDRLHDPEDELAGRMQQLSGATMAKGVEDTAFYRYSRFIAVNEVGGDPEQVGIPVEEFHAQQQVRAAHWPESMTALSTHDTKRGEDVRARLAVLPEILLDWEGFARLFLDRAGVPSPTFGYFLAQTLVGAGLAERDRMHAYAEKAMREASQQTTWTAPDPAFEQAVHTAVDRAYEEPELGAALAVVLERVEAPGWSNALGQKLVQLTMPGVPDVYQGTELWEDSLVDPDNRRPVDFAERRRLLTTASSPPPVDGTGAAKLWVTSRALRLRHDRPEAFTGYTPVAATGPRSHHLLAYERTGVLTLATRLPVGLQAGGGWDDTTLDLGGWAEDALTGRTFDGEVAVAEVLQTYPVALLERR